MFIFSAFTDQDRFAEPLVKDTELIQRELRYDDQWPAESSRINLFWSTDSADEEETDEFEIFKRQYNDEEDYKSTARRYHMKFLQNEMDMRFNTLYFHELYNHDCYCLQRQDEVALYDVNDEEIVLESDLEVRYLDQGLWVYLGYNPNSYVLDKKEFSEGWDESSDESDSADDEDSEEWETNRNDSLIEQAVRHGEEESSEESKSSSGDETEYDGRISIEKRDKIFE